MRNTSTETEKLINTRGTKQKNKCQNFKIWINSYFHKITLTMQYRKQTMYVTNNDKLLRTNFTTTVCFCLWKPSALQHMHQAFDFFILGRVGATKERIFTFHQGWFSYILFSSFFKSQNIIYLQSKLTCP